LAGRSLQTTSLPGRDDLSVAMDEGEALDDVALLLLLDGERSVREMADRMGTTIPQANSVLERLTEARMLSRTWERDEGEVSLGRSHDSFKRVFNRLYLNRHGNEVLSSSYGKAMVTDTIFLEASKDALFGVIYHTLSLFCEGREMVEEQSHWLRRIAISLEKSDFHALLRSAMQPFEDQSYRERKSELLATLAHLDIQWMLSPDPPLPSLLKTLPALFFPLSEREEVLRTIRSSPEALHLITTLDVEGNILRPPLTTYSLPWLSLLFQLFAAGNGEHCSDDRKAKADRVFQEKARDFMMNRPQSSPMLLMVREASRTTK